MTLDVRRRPAVVVLAIYCALLIVVALWPTPVDLQVRGVLRDIAAMWPWVGYALVEFIANVVLFVPFGLLGGAIMPARWVLVVPVSAAAAIAIEVGQALLLPQRTASLADVVANVLGAAIGVAIFSLASGRAHRRRAEGGPAVVEADAPR